MWGWLCDWGDSDNPVMIEMAMEGVMEGVVMMWRLGLVVVDGGNDNWQMFCNHRHALRERWFDQLIGGV